MFGVVDDPTTTKFVNRACAVHGISLPVVVDKVVVVVLKFPNSSGCETSLLELIEDWKLAADKKKQGSSLSVLRTCTQDEITCFRIL